MTTKGKLTYAIGDIHGRMDLFELALTRISEHAAKRPHRVILLGDLVDRGPDSAGVVATAMDLTDGETFITLKGNHEDLMLRSLRGASTESLSVWLNNGGEQTLLSYGGPRAVPETHLDWLQALPLTWRDSHRVFVHAGLAPGVPLAMQSERAMLWIREVFLAAPAADFPCHVVHGHTPKWSGKPDMAAPERLAHRTNLDTGAYATGCLSIGVFDDAVPGGPTKVLTVEA